MAGTSLTALVGRRPLGSSGVTGVILATMSSSGGSRQDGRRRGRPPATDSNETLRSLLDTARALFAVRGYDGVTNKELAAAAGLTAGALYHYVDSKLDLYVAVEADVQRLIYARFQQAVASSDTFIGKLEAVLDAAAAMNAEDPTLATFVGVVRTDLRRHPEVAERLERPASQREQFFVDIVDVGVRTGEIDVADRHAVDDFIRTILIGLTDGVSDSPERHRSAIEGIKRLLHGTLVRPLTGSSGDGSR
jgi:AcrR family transcriptional regulator